MSARAVSLRLRLGALILVPLLVISLLAGLWRFEAARRTAEELFDRSLFAVTLAVSRDFAATGGDALSVATRDLIREASGGEVFYHVAGPDGVLVTGYAYPPPPPPEARGADGPVLFDASHRGEPVRVSRLRELTTVDGISGYATVTAWQTLAAREALTLRLALRAALLMSVLVATVAGVVWFGIRLGLKPLADLQQAIALRSSDELGPIRRPIPPEVAGVVKTLNTLFHQLSRTLAARDAFIADAAHQLRNPVAAVLSLAQAARDAPNDAARCLRIEETLSAARRLARLTEQLLALERVRGGLDADRFAPVDVEAIARETAERNADRALAAGIEFEFRSENHPMIVLGDRVALGEALENLVDNALSHGGEHNDLASVSVRREGGAVVIVVQDTGPGLPPESASRVFERFVQLDPGVGSGLGLAIVQAVAEAHGGSALIADSETGARFELRLPLAGRQVPADP